MNTTAIVFISIFGVVIIVLVGVAIFGVRKDKRKKKNITDSRNAVIIKSKVSYYKTILFLNELINFSSRFMDDFKHHKTNHKSLGDMNKYIASVLQKLQISNEYKNLMDYEDVGEEIFDMVKILSKVRATKWKNEAFFYVNVIVAKADAYNRNKKFDDYIEKIKKSLKV